MFPLLHVGGATETLLDLRVFRANLEAGRQQRRPGKHPHDPLLKASSQGLKGKREGFWGRHKGLLFSCSEEFN